MIIIKTITIHKAYYPKQITRKFKTVLSPPKSIYYNAESNNIRYMPYSYKMFGITMNKKCLVSGYFFQKRLNSCEVRKLDKDGDDDNNRFVFLTLFDTV